MYARWRPSAQEGKREAEQLQTRAAAAAAEAVELRHAVQIAESRCKVNMAFRSKSFSMSYTLHLSLCRPSNWLNNTVGQGRI